MIDAGRKIADGEAWTAPSTVEAVVALAKRLGKTPVVVKDSPGFVVNRLLCPMLNEAVLAYAEGIATAAATASMHLRGAGKPRVMAPTVLRANWNSASALAGRPARKSA